MDDMRSTSTTEGVTVMAMIVGTGVVIDVVVDLTGEARSRAGS